MRHPRGPIPLTWGLVSVLFLATALVLIVACGGGDGEHQAATSDASNSEAATPITVYRSPTCGCCGEYESYLADRGFDVERIKLDDLSEIKASFGVPEEMKSCHTAVVEGYFVEGHVPVEAIGRLLEERPAIDGIALPGMPAGSPGMGGDKGQPFVIYSVTDGAIAEFMTV